MHLLEFSSLGFSHNGRSPWLSSVEKLGVAWKQPRLLLSRVGCFSEVQEGGDVQIYFHSNTEDSRAKGVG